MGAVFSPHMHLKTGTDRSRHVSFKTEFPWPLPARNRHDPLYKKFISPIENLHHVFLRSPTGQKQTTAHL